MQNNADLPNFLRETGLQMLMFGGKGGVGKTTCAVSAALALADRNPAAALLLVSTDPAHSLQDSLAGSRPPENLEVLEFDAPDHLKSFKKKHNEKFREIAKRGTFLDDDDISRFLDLSLPGMDELMAFLEIVRWVEAEKYHTIIVDTAPTGHTLRLLGMPQLTAHWLEALDTLLSKHRYMKKVFSGSYQKDDLDVFILDLSQSVEHFSGLLQDPERCRFVPVMLAEELSVSETLALLQELRTLDMPAREILINRMLPQNECSLCGGRRLRQNQIMVRHREEFCEYTLWGLPLRPAEVRGIQSLTGFLEYCQPSGIPNSEFQVGESVPSEIQYSDFKIVDFPVALPSVDTQFVVFAGKGGVGKTTLASAAATRLAAEFHGKEVFLFSSDPAHSLSACFDRVVGSQPTRLAEGLTAMEIDGPAEFEALKHQYAEELEHFLERIAPNFDLTFDREVMERIMDLSPPGIDEIMALNQAMEFLIEKKYDLLILDSAPTGHLVRLLEMPELIDQWLKVFFDLFLKYKRIFNLPEVAQRMIRMSKDIKYLRSLLKDGGRSSLYAVSNLTEMALAETKDLIGSCQKMSIHIPALFLNMATPESGCGFCSALIKGEKAVLNKFKQNFGGMARTIVYQQEEPRGPAALEALGQAMFDHVDE